MTFNGYRASKAAGGGLYNGYQTPRAKQEWAVGSVVNVGFLKGLQIVAKEGAEFKLRHTSTGRRYSFVPHMGLSAEAA